MDSTIQQGPVPAVSTPSQPRLQRNALNLFETIAATLANMAPAEGIFVALAVAVGFMGSVAPWAFLLAMVGIFASANTMGEFSRTRPSAGSFVSFIANGIQGYFPRAALFVSSACFVVLMLGYIISTAAAVAFLGYWLQLCLQIWLHISLPGWSWAVIATVALLIAAPLLLRSVVIPTIWSFVLFMIEAVALLFMAIALLFIAHNHLTVPFTNMGGVNVAPGGFSGLVLAFPIAVLGFVGWDNSGPLSEETKHPRRSIAITVFVSVLIIGLIYFLSSYAMVVGYAAMHPTNPMDALLNDQSTTNSPFLAITQYYMPWFLVVLAVIGVTSSAGYYIASAVSQTRIIFNSGREGLFPRFFARVARGRIPVPYVSVLTYVILSLALIIVPAIWLSATGVFVDESIIGTVPIALVYLLANIALPFYFWKYQRSQFNWFRHLVVPLIGVAVLILPISSFFLPSSQNPPAFFWIFFGLLAASGLWGLYVVLRHKEAVQTLGTMVADE
jgi:amino acid transporter